MTPQERQLVDDLFDRLSRLENAPREPAAQAAIAEGLRRAPNALYTLVQTVLVQDEALKRADAHIQELEAAAAAPAQNSGGGFLDSMRDAVLGPSSGRGSAPNVAPGGTGQRGPVWNSGQVLGRQDDPRQQGMGGNPGGGFGGPFGGGAPGGGPFGGAGGGGGSFLGTAAAAAAGVVGGSMLMSGIRGLMGGGGHQSFSDLTSGGSGASPWSNQSSSDLARDAGVNDVSKVADDSYRQGSYDQAQADADQDQDQDQDDDDDYDADLDSGDSDYA